MNIFFKWLKFDSRAKFCLIALSALGAHLFAVTSFKMLDYYVTEDWVCGNLIDLSIIAGSLMLVVCSSFAVRSLHAVRHASDIWVFLGFLAFVAFQWLALAVHHSIDHWHATPVRAFIMILVPLFLAGLNEAFTRFGSARVAVVKQVKAPSVKGLVLFLSYATKAPTKPPQSLEPPLPVKPPLPVEEFFTHDVDGKETQLWTDLQKEIKTLTDALDGSIKNQGIWASFKRRNWRMPITAIGYQYLFELPRLSKIIVIASKDSCQGKGSGSARQFGFFKDRVEALCKAAEVELPEVKCLQPEGIDFEDCDAISRAVQEAKEYFREQKIGDYLVDITSGTALCSSTGAALTLDESEAFQYVSTNDYSVRKFDLEYEPRKETIHH